MSDAKTEQYKLFKMNQSDKGSYTVSSGPGDYVRGMSKPTFTDYTKPDFKPVRPDEVFAEQKTNLNVGTKLDNGKPQVSLIPKEAIMEMAIAFTYGAKKYSSDNFKLGIKYRRLLDAALRHILAIADGEFIDDESKNSHVGHALASLAMLAYMMKNKPEFDDIFKKEQETK